MVLEARRNPLFHEPVSVLYQRYNDVVAESLSGFGIARDVEAIAREGFASLDGLVLQHVAGLATSDLRGGASRIWAALELIREQQSLATPSTA